MLWKRCLCVRVKCQVYIPMRVELIATYTVVNVELSYEFGRDRVCAHASTMT